jgi:DNA modification methylase
MSEISIESATIEFYSKDLDDKSNPSLYDFVAKKLKLTTSEINHIEKIGKRKSLRNVFHRRVRWVQQTLKNNGFIEKIKRGHWQLTKEKKIELHVIEKGNKMVGMSTNLGIAIWGCSEDIFDDVIEGEIQLCLTSPPYPIRVARAYGKIEVKEYTQFVCRMLKPIVRKLAKGGNIALNISNDIFEEGSPARSTYMERLIVALEDDLGLSLMDRLIWESNKMPGPILYASGTRQQLNQTWEPVLWLTNDPLSCIADNRRVLQPHTEAHKKYMASGGSKTTGTYGDGADIRKKGDYSNITEGKIARNILKYSNYCKTGREANKLAKHLGIAPHGAKMPYSLADFLVKFMSKPGGLVVDLFGGTLTSAEAAENNGREWVVVERVWEYIRQSFVRFKDIDDLYINPKFIEAIKTF